MTIKNSVKMLEDPQYKHRTMPRLAYHEKLWATSDASPNVGYFLIFEALERYLAKTWIQSRDFSTDLSTQTRFSTMRYSNWLINDDPQAAQGVSGWPIGIYSQKSRAQGLSLVGKRVDEEWRFYYDLMLDST